MRFLLLLLPLCGCSIEKRGAPGTDPYIEIDVAGSTAHDSVEVIISAPRAAAVGDEVPISVVVQNNRERHIDLNLAGQQILFDIIVARADSTIAWQRLANSTAQHTVQHRTLAPGESFTLSDHWKAAEAGQFIIGAELPTDTRPLQAAPVTIVIR